MTETVQITTKEQTFIGNSDADMYEDQVIRQADDPLPRAPKTFAMKRGIGNRYPWPPCTRYGCGKREILLNDFKSTGVIKEVPGSKMSTRSIKKVVSEKENL
ncbi:hypothetical protein ACROYT_G019025 [Oculina patagonica]